MGEGRVETTRVSLLESPPAAGYDPVMHVALDGSPAAYTNLLVKGESLYTGKAETVTASFVGGFLAGQRIFSAEEPTASETQVGRKVVVFTSPWPSKGNAPPRCLVAQHAGIFTVQPGPQGDVVLGKGEGFAIERNVLLQNLKAQAAEFWRTRPQPQKPK